MQSTSVAPARFDLHQRLVAAGRITRQAVAAAARPLRYFVVGRVVTLLAMLAVSLTYRGATMAELLSAWDAKWYLRLIATGYPDHVPEIAGRAAQSVIGYFPLYPIIVRSVERVLFLPDIAAAVLVSIVFGAVAVVLMQQLARMFVSEPAAERAAIAFAVFPGSLVFAMPYTEALMLALTAGCFLALFRGRWVTAGVCAALATASRPNALALVVACGWQALVVVRQRREWKALIAPALAPLGVLGYFLFLKLHTGEFTAWFRTEREGWHQGPTLSWHSVKPLLDFFRVPFGGVNEMTVGFGCLLVITGLLLLWRRWPQALSVYVVFMVFMGTNTRLDGFRPRALLTEFPLLLAVGAACDHRRLRWLVGLSLPIMAFLTVNYTTGTIGQI